MINTETNYRWFIFYQDQLLLEKNDNAFSIPTGKNTPVTTSEGITVHTITTATGMVMQSFLHRLSDSRNSGIRADRIARFL